MNASDPYAVPAASSAALRASLAGVRAAMDAAWTVALAVLADASGGSIHQYNGLRGAAHSVATSKVGRAKIVPDSIGDRAELQLYVNPTAYERIREHLLEECPHDEECDCEDDPWPALAELPRDADVEILDLHGDVRGTVNRASFGAGPVTLALVDESVWQAAEALRIATTTAHPDSGESP